MACLVLYSHYLLYSFVLFCSLYSLFYVGRDIFSSHYTPFTHISHFTSCAHFTPCTHFTADSAQAWFASHFSHFTTHDAPRETHVRARALSTSAASHFTTGSQFTTESRVTTTRTAASHFTTGLQRPRVYQTAWADFVLINAPALVSLPYVYIHICIRVYKHICMYTYTYIRIYAYIYIAWADFVRINAPALVSLPYVHTYIYMYVRVYNHKYIYIYIYMYICMYIYSLSRFRAH